MQIPNKDWREKKESVQNLLDIIIVVSCFWKYANVPKSVTYFVKQLNVGQGTVPALNSVLRNAGYFTIILRSYLTSKHVK